MILKNGKENKASQGANLVVDSVLMSDKELKKRVNDEKDDCKHKRWFILYDFPENEPYGNLKKYRQEIGKRLLSYYKGTLTEKIEGEKVMAYKLVDGALQFERGKENNLPHFHMCLRFKEGIAYSNLCKKVARLVGSKLKFAVKVIVGNKKSKDGGWSESYSYCTKKYTRILGLPVECRKKYDWSVYEKSLDKFQERVVNIIHEQGIREIFFIVDKRGGIGKSYLKSYLVWLSRVGSPYSEYFAVDLCSSLERPRDVMQSVMNVCKMAREMYSKDLKEENLLVLIDIPRGGTDQRNGVEFAKVLEKLKQGSLSDERYKHTEDFIMSPKVVVFLNDDIRGVTIPDKEKGYYLSVDRVDVLYVPDCIKRYVSKTERRVEDVKKWFKVESTNKPPYPPFFEVVRTLS